MRIRFLILILFFFGFIRGQKLQKIEPPFWWSGMQNSELQILLYGKNIAKYEVEVSKAKLLNLIKTENPNYIFLLTDVSGLPAGFFNIYLKNKGKIAKKISYELKKRSKNSRNRKGFDSSDVIYLLMPDRFANGNPLNDSVTEMSEKADRNNPDGRHGGDIQGIINHLDYLKDLGVTSLWSTPLLSDNEHRYSYHTYAQSDLYHIDPRYGTNADYKKLAEELHKRKMKLIMDYVVNHWGSQHWMIRDLPMKNWIIYWDSGDNGFKRSNYRMSTQFDPNVAEIDKKECVNAWFDRSMPDMNLKNPILLKYITQNAIWWIEYAGLDGLRVDTYSYNDKEGISQWTKAILDEYPSINIVGEVWMHNQAQIAYWQKNSRIGAIQSYNSYLPSVMDFTLYDAIKKMFNEQATWFKGMIRAYDNFTNDFLYPNPDNIMVFLGNHDVTRINTILKSDFDKYKLALTLILTTRGIPQLYYGDEIGMNGDKNKGDADLRKDFPGGWKDDKQNAFDEKSRTAKQNKYYHFTRKLLNYRKNNDVLHTGKLLQFVPINNVYVYFRLKDDKSIMIVLNNSDKTQILDLKRFSEGIKSYKKGKEIISGKILEMNNQLIIQKKSAMVIELY